jgi:4-hydroxyphenylacetate 3-monooxygenase
LAGLFGRWTRRAKRGTITDGSRALAQIVRRRWVHSADQQEALMRRGDEYLAALKDDREIYLDGERVRDVAGHPAFAPVARTIAELYDLAADPLNGMTYTDAETGREANQVFRIPRSREELAARRRAIEIWARHTHGWVGRGPDHVGAFLAGFASCPQAFAREPHDFAANVTAGYRRLLDESLFVSYAIIPPQFSRATTAHGWDGDGDGDFIQAGVVEERAEGIVIRGAQMLATGASVADEILISCIKPLAPQDRDFAVSFMLPMATEGMKLYCRRPYATGATSAYDYPLSSRYDETDALVVFDDVLVPWDRVFVDRDVAGLRRQFFDTGAHIMGNSQAQIRFVAKLQFILGLARKIAAVNGIDRISGVQEKLGELASLASVAESAVMAAEYQAAPDENGMWRPDPRALYGAMGLQAELYPRVLATVRDLAGGGVLQLPASVSDMTNPATRRDVDRYVRSPGVDAGERVKLFKLVWDAIGSEFAGRHHQYEMFYAGAPFVAKGYAYRNYGYEKPVADVEDFLASYRLED